MVGPARPVGIRRDGVATVDIVPFTHLFVRTHEQVDWTIYMTFKELVVHTYGGKRGAGGMWIVLWTKLEMRNKVEHYL